MPLDPTVAAERARYAALRRHHPGNPAAAAASLNRLRMLRADQYLRELLAHDPPLTAEQRTELVVLLVGGGHVTT